eukprot:1653107-Amphidinium_carterae.1
MQTQVPSGVCTSSPAMLGGTPTLAAIARSRIGCPVGVASVPGQAQSQRQAPLGIDALSPRQASAVGGGTEASKSEWHVCASEQRPRSWQVDSPEVLEEPGPLREVPCISCACLKFAQLAEGCPQWSAPF